MKELESSSALALEQQKRRAAEQAQAQSRKHTDSRVGYWVQRTKDTVANTIEKRTRAEVRAALDDMLAEVEIKRLVQLQVRRGSRRPQG